LSEGKGGVPSYRCALVRLCVDPNLIGFKSLRSRESFVSRTVIDDNYFFVSPGLRDRRLNGITEP
jgi:hypothetical protein